MALASSFRLLRINLGRRRTSTQVRFTSQLFPNNLRQMTEASSGIAVVKRSPINQMLLQYSYLQMLDFLTTIAFLVNGVKEGNPLVRFALNMGANPIGGLVLIKLLAVALGIYCWRMGRQQLLSRINILFAVLIAWNLIALIIRSVDLHAV